MGLGDLGRARKAIEPLLSGPAASVEALELASRIALQERDYVTSCDLMEQVAQRRPRDAATLYNYGTALSICGRNEQAVEVFERALAIKPDLTVVYPNLGHTLRDLGRSEEAMACYQKVFGMQGVDSATMSQILVSMQLFSQADHEQLFAMHRQLGELIESRNPLYENRRETVGGGDKIRIGYLSPRFSREIVGYFFKPVFDHHDRSRFDIILYNITPRSDELTHYFEQRADKWVEVGGMSDAQICSQVVADEVDILVDLAGHAPENRIGVMARKPAPLQLSMLDYFDTTGLSAMDYYVTDNFSSPGDTRQRFTEKLLHLDQPRLVYEAPDYAPMLEVRTNKEKPLVFGSFNRHHKLVPHVIQTWSKLLLAVPGSRLLLKGKAFGEADSQAVFRQRFAACGIDAQRIEFRGESPHAEMFSEYGDMDIALDTFPYNGGLTTCEALWMGTPVLTLLGERIISRQTAGMLEAVGLPEFIASDESDFVARGVAWAERRTELNLLRRGLRQRMSHSPLVDAKSYTANLENKLLEIWKAAKKAG